MNDDGDSRSKPSERPVWPGPDWATGAPDEAPEVDPEPEPVPDVLPFDPAVPQQRGPEPDPASVPEPPIQALVARPPAPAGPPPSVGRVPVTTAAAGGSIPDPAPPSRLARVLPWALPALIVFLVSLTLDALTIMPGLGYWDTGEFQTLGPVLGIAHPTGYPSYTILLWLASVVLQPFGEPAFRANLLSALLVSGAAAFTAIAIVQLTRKPALANAGGIALAVAPIAWRDALRADPHTFQVFLVGLLLVLLIAWSERERAGRPRAGRWLVASSAAFALAVTNHGLTIALAPGVAAYVLLVQPRILWLRPKTVLACAATLVVLIVGIYAYLPIRSSMNPPLDYAHPAELVRKNADGRVTGGFLYLVSGEQFAGAFPRIPPMDQWSTIPDRIASASGEATGVLRDNLGIPATALALLGIPLGFLRRPREIVLTGLWFAFTFAFSLGYENADISRYYLGPLLVACVWAALSVDAIWGFARAAWAAYSLAPGEKPAPPRPRGVGGRLLAVALVVVATIVLLVPAALAVPDRFNAVDASHDTGARRWLDATLAVLEPNAVVVSWWSYSTPLWYGTYVEGRRPDITVIDDRTIVDDGLGNVPAVVASWYGKRPVYVVRLDRDLPEIAEHWELEPVPGLPGGQAVYRVVGPAGGG